MDMMARFNPASYFLLRNTAMQIPLPADPSQAPMYIAAGGLNGMASTCTEIIAKAMSGD